MNWEKEFQKQLNELLELGPLDNEDDDEQDVDLIEDPESE